MAGNLPVVPLRDSGRLNGQTIRYGSEDNLAVIAGSESETEVMIDRHCVGLIVCVALIRSPSFGRVATSLHRRSEVVVAACLDHRRCGQVLHALLFSCVARDWSYRVTTVRSRLPRFGHDRVLPSVGYNPQFRGLANLWLGCFPEHC